MALRKLTLAEAPELILDRFEKEGIATILPIRSVHLRELRALPSHHRDPFDRMIVAQALVEKAKIVSKDIALDQSGIRRVW